MAQLGTAAFRAAVAASPQQARAKVEVWSQPTATAPAVWLATLGHVKAGSVTEDETQLIRRTCRLQVADDTGGLAPSQVGDLLHPDSYNELRLFRGLALPAGVEYIPMGVYRISKPTTTQDDGGLLVSVDGYDRMHAVQRARWLDPYTLAAGNLATQMQTAFGSRFPGLTYNFSDAGYTTAQAVFGLDASNNDPAQDLSKVAQAAGQEVYFDASGNLVLRTVPDPATQPALFAWADGPGCRVASIQRDLDEARSYNTVVVTGEGPGTGGPWRSVRQVTPAPPVVVPYFFTSPLITSQAMADATAASLLLRVQHAIEDVQADMVPDPQVNSGDVATVRFARVHAGGRYAVQSVATDLGADGKATVVFRPQVSAA